MNEEPPERDTVALMADSSDGGSSDGALLDTADKEPPPGLSVTQLIGISCALTSTAAILMGFFMDTEVFRMS